ncbi:ATPase domain-containing protein [Devosia rhizoryzae]|uniref:non-specific serine/threonine protein kinase n=1 Tax=Devosia rhizoryzae TaxID=2774137 RepID=A0ABX7C5Z7_9HYPH|nr:ATPase domain-containing protein [Devosia rhizoryzae]QQR38050.1 circadian clock protein KaiC [Devosia rhizoryzae]
MTATSAPASGKANFGIAGLDDITAGGLSEGHLFLLEGTPGTGKTTVAMQFLLAGEQRGELGLYITLSETENELRNGAASHGWDLGPLIKIFELVPPESLLNSEQAQTLLYSSDLELVEATQAIFAEVERLKPKRVVLDSLSEIRLLAQSSLRYRRQILALKHYFARNGATVILLDDLTSEASDKTVHSVAHGVLRLEQITPEYGGDRRRLKVAKYRAQHFRSGFHDFTIATGGVEVFPRLISAEHKTTFSRSPLSSGSGELDSLLGGGLETGSSALIIGPAGTGKSTIGFQYIDAAVARGEKAVAFIFDEELGLLEERLAAMGINARAMMDSGLLHIETVDAAELSPGEFSHRVRLAVDRLGAKIVMIDSLNGYQAAMPQENALILHIHELLQYLNRQGATTILTVAQHGLVGDMKSPVDVTYLADTVIVLRYFEALGKVRRAVSVIKKRTSAHEETIREFWMGKGGLVVGQPLTAFQGVLRGVPTFVGEEAQIGAGANLTL